MILTEIKYEVNEEIKRTYLRKKRTEIIQIAAKYTWEIDVYEKLENKLAVALPNFEIYYKVTRSN